MSEVKGIRGKARIRVDVKMEDGETRRITWRGPIDTIEQKRDVLDITEPLDQWKRYAPADRLVVALTFMLDKGGYEMTNRLLPRKKGVKNGATD